tara:strand:+ start:3879 stop:4325 length:447 start_codon:yes stop_codon:yes gene_type:complete
MAWQIYESNSSNTDIILAGIANGGYLLAEKIVAELRKISPLEVNLHKIIMNKKDPLGSEMHLEPEAGNLQGRSITVVDDVLNSGNTLIYGVRYFLQFPVREIKTAVLVDRNHKRFPVKADFKGLSLSTSLMEHVDVNIEKEPYSVKVS